MSIRSIHPLLHSPQNLFTLYASRSCCLAFAPFSSNQRPFELNGSDSRKVPFCATAGHRRKEHLWHTGGRVPGRGEGAVPILGALSPRTTVRALTQFRETESFSRQWQNLSKPGIFRDRPSDGSRGWSLRDWTYPYDDLWTRYPTQHGGEAHNSGLSPSVLSSPVLSAAGVRCGC
jgi:hypothetical protein